MDFLNFFKDKTIIVIGGTGSIGSEIVTQLLKYSPKTIRILSNSENEIWETKQRFKEDYETLRFLLGDIMNFERMKRAIAGADYVFNAAAIKHVPVGEYNPMETVNVNIHGLQNVLEASIFNKVKNLVHISTDKAVNPTTVMGATKMLGERICISRALAYGSHTTIISCVRFGNVLGSRGSIIPLIKTQIKRGNEVTLTDDKMQRFFLTISQAVKLVLKATVMAKGAEIYVLKMPTIVIKDLIEVIIEDYCPKIGKKPSDIKFNIIGPRFGEKLDEELISSIEFDSCFETKDMYVIYPVTYFEYNIRIGKYYNDQKKVEVDKSFQYSTKVGKPLSKAEIRDLIKEFTSNVI